MPLQHYKWTTLRAKLPFSQNFSFLSAFQKSFSPNASPSCTRNKEWKKAKQLLQKWMHTFFGNLFFQLGFVSSISLQASLKFTGYTNPRFSGKKSNFRRACILFYPGDLRQVKY